jgi:hypothetical protein
MIYHLLRQCPGQEKLSTPLPPIRELPEVVLFRPLSAKMNMFTANLKVHCVTTAIQAIKMAFLLNKIQPGQPPHILSRN